MKKLFVIPEFDFVSNFGKARLLSFIFLFVSIVSLISQGLRPGIDFTGGTLVEVGYSQSVDLELIRNNLEGVGITGANVQYFGSSQQVLIRLKPREEDSATTSNLILRAASEGATIRRVEFVGPKVGKELKNQGGLAVLYALIAILIYIATRFEYRFALGSIFALIHDIVLTLGWFSLLQIEFDLSVLAAVLAVIGYSLNDTIVVFDRIRENFLASRQDDPRLIINNSLNQTLTRTIMTSATTLLVLLALFFLGGEIIHNFAIALLVGVLVGTYSSIFVASSSILSFGISKKDLLPSVKEQQEIDNRP